MKALGTPAIPLHMWGGRSESSDTNYKYKNGMIVYGSVYMLICNFFFNLGFLSVLVYKVWFNIIVRIYFLF